jgi:hypothetical protein
MFALSDEPEKAARWAVFLVGGLVAAGLQGGTLYGAAQYTAPERKESVLVEMQFFEPPPPPPPTAAPPPPPTEPPPPPPPTTARSSRTPSRRSRRRRRRSPFRRASTRRAP